MNLIHLSTVLFGGGSSYTPTPPPDVPGEDSPEVKAAAEEAAKEEQQLARNRKGRRSTILTSGLGLGGAPSTKYAQLTGSKSKLGA